MLRYTPEQVNILEAQMGTYDSVYKLSRDGNEWAKQIISTIPIRIGDKWNSMTKNVLDWAQNEAGVDELLTYLLQIHSGYIRSELRTIWRKRQ